MTSVALYVHVALACAVTAVRERRWRLLLVSHTLQCHNMLLCCAQPGRLTTALTAITIAIAIIAAVAA
jgi:uncharacterized membrane protein YhfC